MGLFRVRGRLIGPTGRSEDAELLVDAGASEPMEFTVIGGNVNLGARVDRLTCDHRVEILLTGAVRQTLDPRFVLRDLPPVALRGGVRAARDVRGRGLPAMTRRKGRV